MLHRGDIWWGEIEGYGRRPYLILSRTAALPVLSRIVCAPITRTIRDIPSEIALGPDDGMPLECAANFDNLATIPKANLTVRITHIAHRSHEICQALDAALECD